jgi:TonB family protein
MAVPAQAAGDRSIKTRVAPSYPEIAKRMRVFGKVKVEATVDPEGKVTAVKTIDGNHLLAMAAEDAVRRWKFEPGNATSTEEVDIDFPRLP